MVDNNFRQPTQIVFVDPSVTDYQILTSGIKPGIEVAILDPTRDGVSEITEVLEGGNFSAVHIVSHGSPGSIQLGTAQLNSETLETVYAASLATWRESLTPDADILLYGCNVAAETGNWGLGKESFPSPIPFIFRLAQLTGANVAASDDLTGSAALGGDWDLEVSTGEIEASAAFQDEAMQAYNSVLATFTVGNTFDSGIGSLRQAILNANASPGLDDINFAIGIGFQTISPFSPLPTITDPVRINGNTQPNFAGNPIIEINGTFAGAGASGLVLGAGSDGSTIQGLVINRFNAYGIVVQSNGNNIRGNHIGTDAAGNADQGNNSEGILIQSANNVIGGTAAADRNVISGNDGFRGGIWILGAGATNNQVLGNYIGTNAAGTAAIGNTRGIVVDASNNIIGDTAAGARNIISGNANQGVWLVGNGNQVLGNYIGTDVNGNADLGNGNSGVFLNGGASNSIIGGTTAAARNVISGNNNHGIDIFQTTTQNNQILGNYIGTNAAGTADLGNSNTGVFINGAVNTIIGGTTPGAGNIISGNDNHGIFAGNAGGGVPTGTTIQGNNIGTNVGGTAALGNSIHGILIADSPNNIIGGGVLGARNVISGNTLRGVNITGALSTNNQIQGNYIGTNAAGTGDLGNGWAGVTIDGNASQNLIGSNGDGVNDTGERNVIANNDRQGNTIGGSNANIQIFDANNNTVAGNFIGTDATGNATFPVSGGVRGIQIGGGQNNIVGGTTAATRNIISGNQHVGVELGGATATNNRVIGNYIGTNVTGTAAIGNGNAGIQIFFAQANFIGTDSDGVNDAAEGNLISGNGVVVAGSGNGVILFGNTASNNRVAGNRIGTDVTGNLDLGNSGDGVQIVNAPNNIIGGTAAVARNTISGNNLSGVFITGTTATGNQILGNYIGTDINGTADLGNSFIGVGIDNATGNTIGGTTTGTRNIISGNDTNGVELRNNANNNQVLGNYIGTDVNGTSDLGNTGRGVLISNAPNNTIGGNNPGSRNILSGNNFAGISILGNAASGNTVRGNFIGTDASGTADLGNGIHGILVQGAPNNTIGGTTAADRNIISGNNFSGIALFQPATTGNVVQGNYIGTDVNGTADLGNTSFGIRIDQAVNNQIGGGVAGARNVISGNDGDGIIILGTPPATGNVVQGNFIGTQANGTSPLGNSGNGVLLDTGANSNPIGGTAAGEGNQIANNGAAGVRVNGGSGDRILGNSIAANAGLGIDLGGLGITPNDVGDGDTGANNLQNFPVLLAAEPVAGNTAVLGTFNSLANTNYRLEFFSNTANDLSGNGEGQTFRGFTNVTTDASGNANFTFNIAASLVGQFIAATATNLATNDTSEFSNARVVRQPTITLAPANLTQNEGNLPNTTPYNFTVTLDQPSSQDIVVNYTTNDGTATTADSDYQDNDGSLTFTAANIFNPATVFNPANLSQTLTVNVNGDNKVEPNETFTVQLNSASNATINPTANQSTGTITNDDSQPTISINDIVINPEGNSGTTTTADFTVSLSNPSSSIVFVNYATADGTATNGSDYVTIPSTPLVFNPGETTKTITVTANGDNLDETDETFSVNLSGATNATITDPQGVATITDDDNLSNISISDVTLTEGTGGITNALFTVSLNAASGQPVNVNYSTADATAVAGSDYAATAGSLTFNPGEISKSILVPVNGDSLDEIDENFNINLSGATNANIVDPQGVATITDDDNPPTISIGDVTVQETASGTTSAVFTVNLSAASSKTIALNYATSDGTATAPADYTAIPTTPLVFNPGETQKTIAVTINGDNIDEPNETFNVNISDAINASIADNQGVGTITNDDISPTISISDVTLTEGTGGTTNAVFTVNLSATSGKQVGVNYATADGTAVAGSDYTTIPATSLTFNPGEIQKTISVAVNPDSLDEINETFSVNLSGATNASIADNQGNATINDDDNPPAVSISDVTLIEGTGGTTNALFTVSLNTTSGQPVIVNYATSDGTATAGNDYGAIASTPLTFNPGEASKIITVAVNSDSLAEANEIFNVNLTSATNATIADNQGVGTINDDDAASTISINDITLTEGTGGTTNAVFTVSLNAASGQPITVNYATTDGTATAGSDYTAIASTPLTFNPGEINKTITVAVNPDSFNEPDETLNIDLTAATNATIADNRGVATINDDDEPVVPSDPDCFCDQLVRPDAAILLDDAGNGSASFSLNPVQATQFGGDSDDTLIGTDVNDLLNGFGGNDLLIGKAGNDNLFGGIGNDLIDGNAGNDIINGNAGEDTVRGGQGNDILRGGQGDDLIWGDRGADTISGDRGNDTLFGGNSEDNAEDEGDFIFGRNGDDFINGNAGNDSLYGDEGNDTVRGGKSDDLVYGDAGDDLLFGDLGNDSLCGGDGNDTLSGGNGNFVSIGNSSEQDMLCGGNGNDLLFGNEGEDNLNGDAGDDTLRGGAENDTLIGGAGSDLLVGDAGSDQLIGGSGSDIFFLTSGKGSDVIVDFQEGQDLLGLGSGLTVQQLEITQSNTSTLISVKSSGELLATLNGIQANLIGQNDFTLVLGVV